MPSEREDFSTDSNFGRLTLRRYDIRGNIIRAFFDAQGALVFVVDDTVYADKPNSLLVINPVGDRKWDDILSNDYDITLELVRPKKDNKYQKLDIEYSGLGNYDALIRDYDAGNDMDAALVRLANFRRMASRNAAAERLAAADIIAENARTTIARAAGTIDDAKAHLKALRSKLAQQKKDVGREPTKQSAAKILRTESQIDAQKDKISKAQRRLDNARRRLATAEDDAEVARAILSTSEGALPDISRAASVPAVAADNTALMSVKETLPVNVADDELPAPVAPNSATREDGPQFKEIVFEEYVDDDVQMPDAESQDTPSVTENIEKGTTDMAEDVKPLFDKDPEILDEEIAFKPIDFQAPSAVAAAPEVSPQFENINEVAPAPLSFTPPTGNERIDVQRNDTMPEYSPVLDTLTPAAAAPMAPANPVDVAPAGQMTSDMARPAPVSPGVPGGNSAAPVARPVPPMTTAPVVPVAADTSVGRRPNLLYYVLLIALIALSIFTLWLYQKKNGDTVPDLTATNKPTVEETTPQPEEMNDTPFISVTEEVAEVVSQPEPVVIPEPEPGPEPIVPVIDDTIPVVPIIPEPEIVEPEPDSPFLTEPEPSEPVVVNKPVYNAGSQNENMFVAADDYDTDVAAAPSVYQDVAVTVENEPDAPMCEDGTAPDVNGCCTGEVYADTGGNGMACCSEATGECYQPMF